MLWQSLTQPWRTCLEEAWRAYCAGSIPIGAAITDRDGDVIARGRNCLFEPSAEGYSLSGNQMAHAEMNALLALGSVEVNPRSCALYTTMEPCPMCTGTARMYGIGAIRYAARDPIAGSISLATGTPFMSRWRVEIRGPRDGDLEPVLLAMQADALLRRGSRWADLTEQAGAAFVPGIRLGRTLLASGELARLRAEAVPIQEVLDLLIRRLREATE